MNISWLFYFQLRLFSLLSNFSPPTIKSTVLIFLVSSSSEGCHPSSCFLNSRTVVSGVTSRTTTFPLICRTGTRKTSMAHQRKEIWPIYLHSMSILRFHVKVYRVANHGSRFCPQLSPCNFKSFLSLTGGKKPSSSRWNQNPQPWATNQQTCLSVGFWQHS